MNFDRLINRTRRGLVRVIGSARYERLKMGTRAALASVAPNSVALAQRAQQAWSKGDAADAERDWQTLAAMQPLEPAWPIKLAYSAELQANDVDAERIVNEAWRRGARSPELAERIAFFCRTNRLSNTSVDEAMAVVRDPDAAPIMLLRAACYLVSTGHLKAGREGIERLPDIPAYASLLRSHNAALDVLEAAQAQGRPVIDGTLSPARDVIFVREPGADTTVIVFTTVRGDCGVPVNAIHALLQPCKVNAIYLFDDRKVFNLDGNTTLGRPYPAMIESLRATLDAWGTRTLIMFGFSAGGFTALRAGLDLKAHGALLFSPVVTLHRRPEFPIEMAIGRPDDDARMMVTEKYMRRTVPHMMTQLPDELRDRTCLQTIEIHYGHLLADLVHVNEVWTVPGIAFRQLDGYQRHECLSEILRRGDKAVVARFIERVRADRT